MKLAKTRKLRFRPIMAFMWLLCLSPLLLFGPLLAGFFYDCVLELKDKDKLTENFYKEIFVVVQVFWIVIAFIIYG